jgi:threonine dehydrogenase-like Zn-dependent dehydrogenase
VLATTYWNGWDPRQIIIRQKGWKTLESNRYRSWYGRFAVVERPEPSITTQDEVKVRIIRVGICGTDREEVSGGRAQAPDGQKELVIGHEMFGQVMSVGSSVTRVKPGDYAVFTVRRGCGECPSCLMNRADMCQTGKYRERGIRGLDGYQTEYVVDKEQYVVRCTSRTGAGRGLDGTAFGRRESHR